MPGLARFFLAPRVEDLLTAAVDGPVVVVNLAENRCDALIVTTGGVEALELPQLSQEQADEQVNVFLDATVTVFDKRTSAQARGEAVAVMGQVLAWLWDTVTEPVLTHLGHTRPRADTEFESWPRVWWVPTGPLALLPIHAAGQHTPCRTGPGGDAGKDGVGPGGFQHRAHPPVVDPCQAPPGP